LGPGEEHCGTLDRSQNKMPEDFDIGKVIQRGSRQMDLGDLAKMGHKKVRVIDERRIRELISQAVQVTLEREAEDSVGRERRVAAEKSKAELQERLSEYKARIEGDELASKELEKLRGELNQANAELKKQTEVIAAEKKRIAEESQKEFNNLLKNAQKGLEDKKDAYEKALREMIGSANRSIPQDEQDDLPVIAPAGSDVQAADMLEALNRRVDKLGRLLDEANAGIVSREQDIAMAAAEHRRQHNEIDRLKKEVDELKLEVRDKERQIDASQQDMAVAAGDRRKDKEVIERLGSQLDESRDSVRDRERQLEALQQDLGTAAGDRRKDKEVIERLGSQLDEARDEIRDKQRQIDQREQDVAMAALEQRRLREDLNKAREEAARVAELNGEVRRLNSERDLLMARLEEFREREREAASQIANMTDKLTEVQGSGARTSDELMEAISGMKGSIGEEIQRQVSWALSAQKTGSGGIDPGMQLDALFSQEIETNIESVKVEEGKGKTLTDKLAKLREARNAGLGNDA